jgi:hypothetical protein
MENIFGHKKCARNENDNGRAGLKILGKLVLVRVGAEVHIDFKPPKRRRLISNQIKSSIWAVFSGKNLPKSVFYLERKSPPPSRRYLVFGICAIKVRN